MACRPPPRELTQASTDSTLYRSHIEFDILTCRAGFGVRWSIRRRSPRGVGGRRAARRVPQIVVTFEIVSHGILFGGVDDKGLGKSEQTTISDRGRPTEEQIQKMILEVEQVADVRTRR